MSNNRGLIISDAVQYGIKDTVKMRLNHNCSEKYKDLVKEADEKIKEDNERYRNAINKSRFY